MKLNLVAFLSVCALLLAGCGGNTMPDPDAENGGSMADFGDSSSDGMVDDGMGGGEFIADDGLGMDDELEMIIYFDFDQSTLRAEYSDTLQRHAANLANDSRAQIRLEGHADERGSREYNIGLGERRSQAVRSLLLIQGATADQISTVSFGEERPAAFGSDEESYELNRRVEIKYIN